MNKKVVCFICKVDAPFNGNSLNTGLGGSETWTLQMANKFANNGYHVIVFNDIQQHMIYGDVEYVPYNMMELRFTYQYFNYIFILRCIDQKMLRMIKDNNENNNIYLVAHDIHFWINEDDKRIILNNRSFDFEKDLKDNEWAQKHIKKIFFMSKYHYEQNKSYYPENICRILGNGIDIENSEYPNRDNSILWSSCYERGLDTLCEYITPVIIRKIPDFKIYCCSYNGDVPNEYKKYPFVVNLGKLSKSDLYKEMRKHKAWVYPNTFFETFCITAIEQAMCDVELVMPLGHGLSTIFDIFHSNFLYEGYDFYANSTNVANIVIERIQDYYNEDRKIIRNSIRNYIIKEYSWDSIYNKFIDELK